MPKFRKKPVEVEAWLWRGGNPLMMATTPPWLEAGGGVRYVKTPDGVEWLEIETPHDLLDAIPGDWIVRGTMGEIYPCSGYIFEQAYEPISTANEDSEQDGEEGNL